VALIDGLGIQRELGPRLAVAAAHARPRTGRARLRRCASIRGCTPCDSPATAERALPLKARTAYQIRHVRNRGSSSASPMPSPTASATTSPDARPR
jgi:hypothetical protein